MADGASPLDELLGPGDWLEVLYQNTEQAGLRHDGGGAIQVILVGGPAKCHAQVGQFDSEPVVCLPLAGAIPQLHAFRLRVRRSNENAPHAHRSHRRGRPVAPPRTGGSSPALKTECAPTSGRRRAGTCAPTRQADRVRRNHRRYRSTSAGTFEVKATGEHRTPLQQLFFPRRRVGRRTTALRGAASGDVQVRGVTPLAAGTAGRGDHALRPRSSTPSSMPPAQQPVGCRRDGRRFP